MERYFGKQIISLVLPISSIQFIVMLIHILINIFLDSFCNSQSFLACTVCWKKNSSLRTHNTNSIHVPTIWMNAALCLYPINWAHSTQSLFVWTFILRLYDKIKVVGAPAVKYQVFKTSSLFTQIISGILCSALTLLLSAGKCLTINFLVNEHL